MSEPKWTKGEWKYGVRRDGSIWISRGEPATGPHYQSDFCGTEKDAALTCAAPELYEVVDAMICAVDYAGMAEEEAYRDWVRHGRVALKKARGEA